MKNKLISIILAGALLSAASPAAFASITMSDKIDTADNKCTFTVDVGKANIMVAFKVYNQLTNDVIYMKDTTSGSDGKAEFIFYNEAEAGSYAAVAKNCETDETVEKSFSSDPEAVRELIESAANAVKENNTAELAGLLSECVRGGQISADMYKDGISDEEMLSIAEKFAATVSADEIAAGTINDISQAFYESVVLSNAAEKEPSVTLADMLADDNLRKVLELDERMPLVNKGTANEKDAFSYVGDTLQEKVIAAVFGKDYKSAEAFSYEIVLKTLTQTIYSPASSQQLGDMLEAYADKGLISISAYSGISSAANKAKALQAVTGSSASDYTDVENIVNNAVNSLSTGTGGSSGGSGSSSGGKSSISAGNVSTGIVIAPDISADTQVIYSPQNIFTDMEDYRWAIEATEYLYGIGVISGVGDGRFEPARNVTRAEFVKIIAEAIKMEDNGQEIPFVDVSGDSWAYPYIAAAYNNGIIKGLDAVHFGTDSYVTRQEAAVIIERVMRAYDPNRPVFPDIPFVQFTDIDDTDDWAVDAVNYLYRCEIISGKSYNNFVPKDSLTRAETATLIYRYMDIIGRKAGN